MRARQISLSSAKAGLLRLVARVCEGHSLTLCKAGKPIVELQSVRQARSGIARSRRRRIRRRVFTSVLLEPRRGGGRNTALRVDHD
jgi:antitoxin (DNA-binding transcriptional repressor) of toxin-antitoxin stability system